MSVNELGVIRGPFELVAQDARFRSIFTKAAMRPAGKVPQITTVRVVELSNHRTTKTVGLTTYSEVRMLLILKSPRQTITFYSELLGALSDKAAEGVIAHELAHAWLNEHVRPEESRAREAAADELARKWGFGEELRALDTEAETVN